ncbi:MAG: FAD-binding oxidoreductase [Woeseiaceae bacterium]
MAIERLKAIVGDGGWISDEASLTPNVTEWRGAFAGRTPLLVSPATTAQVAGIVRVCAETATGIVPQGGNTGLCGGAVPDRSGTQIILSLARMDRVRSLSPADFSMVVEAGCVLADVQSAARDADRLFALSLAPEGSCQIGGNLSTNAGGVNVLRYGTARNQVLGLEVVLPDGTIWNGLRALRKDTAGYDLKQLFIGAEGTLGIITAATLRLFPLPDNVQTAVLGIDSAGAAVALLAALHDRLADRIQAFELISARALRYVLRHVPGTRAPMPEPQPWYVLLECAAEGDVERFQAALMSTIDQGLARDAVIAGSARESDEFWRLRHSISEAQKHEGASLKHDVSVPVGRIGDFIEAAERAVGEIMPEARIVAFGHVGDGNVHFNISAPKNMSAAEFRDRGAAMSDAVYAIVDRYAGSFSAEHGIGTANRDLLRRYRDPTELALMRAVKRALDPQDIMNPGKVL